MMFKLTEGRRSMKPEERALDYTESESVAYAHFMNDGDVFIQVNSENSYSWKHVAPKIIWEDY